MDAEYSDEENEIKVLEAFKEHIFEGAKKFKDVKFNHPQSVQLAKLLKKSSIKAQILEIY